MNTPFALPEANKAATETGTIKNASTETRTSSQSQIKGNGNDAFDISLHAQERQLQRGITQNNIDDAFNNPLNISEIKYDSMGRPSVKYIGNKATIVVNPETGKIITVYPTNHTILNRYKGK